MVLDHVQLSCPAGTEDIGRAFYVGVLGLTEVPKPAALAARGGCWFTGYGADVHLGVEPDFRPARKAHPAIRVADLDAVAALLSASGQPVEIDDREIPGRRRFHCHDPYGNRLEFVADPVTSWPCGDRHRVRRARPDDLPAIVALLGDDRLGQHREGDDLTPYRAAFEAIDADPQQFLAAVVNAADEVVGTCQLTFTPGLSRNGTLRMTIEAVRLRADLRGGGLGTAMINWAIGRARERGAGLVQLTSDLTRTDAIRFYLRLGFEASHSGLKLQL